MTSDSELKNLSHVLQVTLARVNMAGIRVTSSQDIEGTKKYIRHITIEPLVECLKCGNLSLAERCLWCEPDDFGGEGVA